MYLELLNRGLQFSLPPSKNYSKEIIIDIEANILRLPEDVRNSIRRKTSNVISKSTKIIQNSQFSTSFKGLKEKLKIENVCMLKADKGNKIVLLDRSDYDSRVENLVSSGSYEKLKINHMSNMLKINFSK